VELLRIDQYLPKTDFCPHLLNDSQYKADCNLYGAVKVLMPLLTWHQMWMTSVMANVSYTTWNIRKCRLLYVYVILLRQFRLFLRVLIKLSDAYSALLFWRFFDVKSESVEVGKKAYIDFFLTNFCPVCLNFKESSLLITVLERFV